MAEYSRYKRSYDLACSKITGNIARLLNTDVDEFSCIRSYHKNIIDAINVIYYNNLALTNAYHDLVEIYARELQHHTHEINKAHLWFTTSAQVFTHNILLKAHKRPKYKKYKFEVDYILGLYYHPYLSLIPAFVDVCEHLLQLNIKNCMETVTDNERRCARYPTRQLLWYTYFGDSETGPCQCCGESMTFEIMTRGHVLAKANGGTNDLDNLRPVCYDCNQAMGTMHMDDYIKLTRRS